MGNVEITEHDIEQGKIVYEALKELLPQHSINQMEYLVKNLGWEGAEFFMSKNRHLLPKEINELHITALKYLHNKYQNDAKEN